MVNTGLSEVIGSWNTMDDAGAADALHAASARRGELFAGEADAAGGDAGGRLRQQAHDGQRGDDLPLPDSPTMPRISPSSRSKLTSSMAVISPRPVWNAVVRPRSLEQAHC